MRPAIHRFHVISGGDAAIRCPSGYSRKHQDLNEGAGGAFIYLCVSWGPRPSSGAFERIHVLKWLEPLAGGGSTDCASPHLLIHTDLNQGAGGWYMYFCFRRAAQGAQGAIVEVDFISSTGSMSESELSTACWNRRQIGGHVAVEPNDLNKGAGGRYIYTCYFVDY